jgi:hypothetical protein
MKIFKASFSFIFSLIIMISFFPKIAKANKLLASIGPIIQMKEPLEGSAFNGPFDFQINFICDTPEKVVDMESLRVIYLKFINIDITEKIRPYIRENSIVVPKMNLPEGNHRIQVKIKDNHKNESEQTFLIRVSKQKNY